MERIEMKPLLRGIALVLLSRGFLPTVRAQAVKPGGQMKKTQQKKAAVAHQDPAVRVFQTHCSRCHSAPETLSPSLTGTVARHMRVRANLTAEEERLIYSFFNP
jgi:cytochrome c5